MATAAVRISALRKAYSGRGGHQPVVAVDGIDVEIASGEIVAFLGPGGERVRIEGSASDDIALEGRHRLVNTPSGGGASPAQWGR